ncbi:hypothetical protein BT69DRAFT_1288798, partial [Atractiella rhizophila]
MLRVSSFWDDLASFHFLFESVIQSLDASNLAALDSSQSSALRLLTFPILTPSQASPSLSSTIVSQCQI